MPNQWKQRKAIMNRYDRTARTYDAQYAEEQEAKFQVALENSPLDDNAVVLDAGCGTGLLFRHLAKRVALVVGIDTSTNLLKQARLRARAHNNIAIVRADADHAPFKTNAFTHTFAITLLQNTPLPATTLKEIKRTTRSNATIIITGLKKHFTFESLSQLIADAGLEITIMRTDEKLKDFIAICGKTPMTPHASDFSATDLQRLQPSPFHGPSP